MNNLSWLLYWADVLPNVSTWLAITSFFLMAIFGIILLVGVTNFFGDADDNRYPHFAPLAKRFRKIGLLAPVFFVLWGASFFVPNKETFYLIAGSEVGEQAIKTPEFQKVRNVVNNFLDKQLDTDNKEDEKK